MTRSAISTITHPQITQWWSALRQMSPGKLRRHKGASTEARIREAVKMRCTNPCNPSSFWSNTWLSFEVPERLAAPLARLQEAELDMQVAGRRRPAEGIAAAEAGIQVGRSLAAASVVVAECIVVALYHSRSVGMSQGAKGSPRTSR